MVQHNPRSQLITIVLSILLIQHISCQILTIDFGTEFVKAAVVHSGAGKSFQIVENHKSERKFYNALGFYDDARHYETEALSKRSKMPTNCFIFSRFLVDFMENPDALKTVKKDLLLEYIKDDQQNQLNSVFELKGFPAESDEITFMDIFSMMIKHVKLAAQKIVKGQIRDVVLVVPVHWNLKMREFITSAAQVTDLHVLSLISENTAASINYALSQRSGNKTETVMFYNLGANSLQMSLVQYRPVSIQKQVKPVQSIFVLGDYGKSYLGGLRFNSLLVNYFAQKFTQKYKKELSLRGRIKLLNEVKKVKEVLSANKEASVFVQGIMDGIDFVEPITRNKFEQLCQPVFQEVTNPIRRFLLDNNMKPSDIKKVQLIGGSVRIPKLQSLIAEIIGNQAQIGTHINGDQAMVLGAAFYGANSSKKFKVKGAHLYDGFNFQIRLVVKNLDQSITQDSERYYHKNITVFKKKQRFGTNKQILLKCKQNIVVQIYKQDQESLQLIRRTQLPKISQINETEFKVAFNLVIDPVDIVTIKDTKYTYKKQEVTTYLEKIKKTTQKQQQTNQKAEQDIQEKETQQNREQKQQTGDEQVEQVQNEEEQQQNNQQAQQAQQENEEVNEQLLQKDDRQTEQQKQQGKQKRKQKKEKKRKQSEQDLYETVEKNKTVTKKYSKDLERQDTFGYAETDAQVKQKSRKLMKIYEQVEQSWRKLAQSKNKLESAIYQIQHKIENQEFLQFVQPEQKEKLVAQAAQQSAWLDDTISNQISDYTSHFDNLNKILSRIKKRISEFHERDQVKKRALQQVTQYKNLTQKLQKEKSWITDEQVEQLRNYAQETVQKIEQIHNKMIEKKKSEDLAYRNKDFLKAAQDLKDKYFSVKATQKPKEQKKKTEKKNQQQDQDEDL